jgi:hypothetical protein
VAAADESSQRRGYWAVEPRTEEGGIPDIYFKVLAPGSPAEMLTFKGDIERTLSSIQSIYARQVDRAKLEEAAAKLTKLAQLGLVGALPATSEAIASLALFKHDIVSREAGRIKNDYMVRLGKWSLSFGFVCAILFFVFDHWRFIPPEQIYRYRNVLLVLTGCMAGAWASFASRKVALAFDDLSTLEDDKLEPPLRLIFAGVLTVILVLVFCTRFANVIIGGFDASNVLSSGSVAVLVGALAGLAEKALPAAMMQRASAFITQGESK